MNLFPDNQTRSKPNDTKIPSLMYPDIELSIKALKAQLPVIIVSIVLLTINFVAALLTHIGIRKWKIGTNTFRLYITCQLSTELLLSMSSIFGNIYHLFNYLSAKGESIKASDCAK